MGWGVKVWSPSHLDQAYLRARVGLGGAIGWQAAGWMAGCWLAHDLLMLMVMHKSVSKSGKIPTRTQARHAQHGILSILCSAYRLRRGSSMQYKKPGGRRTKSLLLLRACERTIEPHPSLCNLNVNRRMGSSRHSVACSLGQFRKGSKGPMHEGAWDASKPPATLSLEGQSSEGSFRRQGERNSSSHPSLPVLVRVSRCWDECPGDQTDSVSR